MTRHSAQTFAAFLLCVLSALPGLARADAPADWTIGPFVRPAGINPVITPNKDSTFDCPMRQKPVHWEATHTFNPAAIVRDGKIYVLYRAEDDSGSGIGGYTSRLGLAVSDDGLHFTRPSAPVVFPADDAQKDNEWTGGCEDPRLVEAPDGTYVLTYTQWNHKRVHLGVATSKDLQHWDKHGPAFTKALDGKYAHLGTKSAAIVTHLDGGRLKAALINGKYWMYFGEGTIHLAASENLIDWTPVEDDHGHMLPMLPTRRGRFDSNLAEGGPPVVLTDKGIVVLYNGKNGGDGDKMLDKGAYADGQALFSATDPTKLLARPEHPFYQPEMPFEKTGQYAAGTTFIEGLVYFKEKWFLYYGCADTFVAVAVYDPKGPVVAEARPARNTGLKEPQPADTLPKSAVPLQTATRKAKLAQQPVVMPDAHGDLLLDRGWELAEAPRITAAPEELSRPGVETKTWYDATVPGTVLTTLVDQGVYPDPYFGLNNMAIPETLNKQDYWYRTTFKLPESYAGKQISLNFAGINYHAQVWLNGSRCGEITGAFIRGIFDITKQAKPGQENVLAVKISPPPHPGLPWEKSLKGGVGPNGNEMCTDGPTFISSSGWDWVPAIRDRCTGIWQDVVVHATGAVTVADPQVTTDLPLPDTSRAEVTIRADVRNATDQEQRGTLRADIEGLVVEQPVTLQPGEKKTLTFDPKGFPALTIHQPHLWWPNGYGKPELYNLKLSFIADGGQASDQQTLRFGIRKFTYTFDPHLTVHCNGRRIMCKGGNWGMDDAMKRVSRAHLEPYLRLQRDANVTILRNWTGESTEETLYSLCDEYGIMVFNEFWISTAGYNMEPRDPDLFLANARDTITRFRNHPSIVVWCGRNEGSPPPVLDAGLDKLCRECDGTRHYQPSSIKLHLMHSGPWHYESPVFYYTKSNQGFTTELGMPSILTAEAMRAFMPAADAWPVSDTWAYHDMHPNGNNCKAYFAAIDNLYGPAANLDDYCRKSQMLNFVNHRAMFEAFNSKLFAPCSGVLIWMSHPAWPSTVWQFYSWDYEPNATYFGVKSACEPIHVQMNLPERAVEIINNTGEPLVEVKATATVYGLDAKELWHKDATTTAAPEACTRLFKIEMAAETTTPVYFVKLELQDAKGTLLSRNFYWDAAKETNYLHLNELPKVTLETTARQTTTGDTIRIAAQLHNPGTALALMTKISLRAADTDQRILPTYYGDNYIALLPGETRQVTVECPASTVTGPLQLDVDGYNVVAQKVACRAE